MAVFTPVTDAATAIGESTATLNGHWSGATEDEFGFSVDAKFLWGFGALTTEAGVALYATESGSHFVDLTGADGLSRDRSILFQFRAQDQDFGFVGGAELAFKTLALAMTFAAIGTTAIRATECDVTVDFNPNTIDSTASIKVQHRLRDAVTPWIDGSSLGGLSGEGVINCDFTIVGLLANTEYEYRFYGWRNTANDTILGSAVNYFTTSTEPAGAGAKAIWLG